MKKISMLLLICAQGMRAQSFHRAAVILQAGTGIESFKTEQTYTQNTGRPDTTIISNAASGNFYGALEFGLSKHFGISARGRMSSFFRDMDDVVRQRTSVKSADMIFGFNFHPIVRKKLDLVLGAEGGVSNIDLSFDNVARNITSGRGTYASVYIEPRIYKKRLGFHVRLSLPMAQYRDMSTVTENLSQQKFAISDWKGKGFGINAGIQLRIF